MNPLSTREKRDESRRNVKRETCYLISSERYIPLQLFRR